MSTHEAFAYVRPNDFPLVKARFRARANISGRKSIATHMEAGTQQDGNLLNDNRIPPAWVWPRV